MNVLPLTDAAARERIRTDLDANLCVEAGAGTGKTTVLVDRVVELLRTGRVGVDDLAVITFTEAAAAELAGRVRHELERAAAAVTDRDDAVRLATAIRDLPRAHIETIHAFAAGLLRERPVEAGIDPGFEVRDEVGAQLGFEAAYGAWLATLLAGDHHDVATAVNRGLDMVKLRRLVEVVNDHRTLLPLVYPPAPRPDVDGFLIRLRATVAEFGVLRAECGTDDKGRADMDQIAAWCARLDAVADDRMALEREVLLRPPKISPSAGRQHDWTDRGSCRRSKQLRTDTREALAVLRAELCSESVLQMMAIAESFVDGYERERKAGGVADYDDLLEWARDLVYESPEARRYFRAQYRAILVDEFQDTDPVQTDLLLCLASDGTPTPGGATMTPRPGALTVVGDPKQSIYRFRRADIAMYDALRDGPLAAGVVALVQNFRSVAGVLDWVNLVFDRVFVAEPGVQPANTRLVHANAVLTDESRSICVVHGGEDAGNQGELRTTEAALLAGTIRRVVDEGWSVRDRTTHIERPAGFGDVAVLVPRRTEIDIYLDAFRRAGVPIRAAGGRSFFARQEVRDLASVLAAVDDPLNRIALVASLRSEFFGCSDEEIFLHVAARGRLDYLTPPPSGSPAIVAEGLAVLRDLHDLRARVSLDELVGAVLESTTAIEIALMAPGGEQAAANLTKLARRAQSFDVARAGGLRGFARWMSDRAAAPDEAEAGTDEETDDVVRMMTVHASKGLEFPIVALANFGSKGSNTVEPVPDRQGRRIHVRLGAQDSGFATPGFDPAWTGEKDRRDAEAKRLLYVALTRARDRVIVPSVSVASGASGLFADLAPSLPAWEPARGERSTGGCFVVDPATVVTAPSEGAQTGAPPDAGAVATAIDARAAWAAERARVIASARAELVVRPATAGDDRAPWHLADRAEEADRRPPVPGGPAVAKGEALHAVLEVVDLNDPVGLEALVRSVCAEADLDEHADEILGWARACLECDALGRARASGRLWREVPYMIAVDGGFATGRIDLVFQEGDALVVIDWKSDAVGRDGLAADAEAHRGQAEAYASALRTTTGQPVREVVFVFPRAPGEAAIPFDVG